ncbi:MAG: M14 family zinc carboxypeptidase [Armatimonadota bacterium]
MIARAAAALILIVAGSAFASPYDDAMRTVRTLSDSRYVRLLPFGRSHSDRSIPAFVISDFTIDSKDKARVLICAGQHGDEFDPVKSVLSLCKRLAAQSDPDVLKKCAIVVVPMVNPDGVAACRRENNVDIDTNRDWIALTTCETKFVDAVIKTWKPNLLIDVHQWNETSATPGNAIEAPSCNMGIRERAMMATAERVRDSAGVALIECHPMSDRSLFHRNYSALGYAAYLLETKNGESYQNRDRIYRTAIKSLITSISSQNTERCVLSPASMKFKSAAVSVYLDPIPDSKSASSSLAGAVMLSIAFVIMACLMKPFSQKEPSGWSKRYTKCTVDPEIGSDRISHKHVPHPITARSWVNRRLRSRYAPAHLEPEAPDQPSQRLLTSHSTCCFVERS